MAPLDESGIEQHKAWVRSITTRPGLHRTEYVMLKNGPRAFKSATLLHCGRDAENITKIELRFDTSEIDADSLLGVRGKSTVLIDTIQRFKGLESPIVILWGLDTIDLSQRQELLYVGMSRAKSLLVIVGSAATCGSFKGSAQQ